LIVSSSNSKSGDRYTPVIETVAEPAPFPDWLGIPSFACLSRAKVVASAAVDEMTMPGQAFRSRWTIAV